jgi:hypothetical protein
MQPGANMLKPDRSEAGTVNPQAIRQRIPWIALISCVTGACLTAFSFWLYASATPVTPKPPDAPNFFDVFTSNPNISVDIQAKYMVEYFGSSNCCLRSVFPEPGSPEVDVAVGDIPEGGVDIRITLSGVASKVALDVTNGVGKVVTITSEEYHYTNSMDMDMPLWPGPAVSAHMDGSTGTGQLHISARWIDPPYERKGAQVAAKLPYVTALDAPPQGIRFAGVRGTDEMAGTWYAPSAFTTSTEVGHLRSNHSLDYADPVLKDANNLSWSNAVSPEYVVTDRDEAARLSNRLFWASGLFGVGLPVLGAASLDLFRKMKFIRSSPTTSQMPPASDLKRRKRRRKST